RAALRVAWPQDPPSHRERQQRRHRQHLTSGHPGAKQNRWALGAVLLGAQLLSSAPTTCARGVKLTHPCQYLSRRRVNLTAVQECGSDWRQTNAVVDAAPAERR